jgi:hypothetical protein
MKGCVRTCLLWLAGALIAAAGYYVYLRRLGEFIPQLWWACGVAGVCTVTSVSYLLGIRTFGKERAMLLGALTGEMPKDGEWVAVSGTIRSLDPVRTPMTAVTAVAYSYGISRIETSSTSNTRTTTVKYFEGKRLAPSSISTRQGTVRLLAVPTLDVPPENTKTVACVANAEQYVHNTAFQTSNTPKDERIGLETEATDDDGTFRLDKHLADSKPDIAGCILEERHIKQGEMVCAFGLYSAARGGLIPHPNWSRQARLMRGDATQVAAELRKRMIKYCIGALIFAAIAFGIVKLYQAHARTHTVASDSTQWSAVVIVSSRLHSR